MIRGGNLFNMTLGVKLTSLERHRGFSIYCRSYPLSYITPSQKVQLTLMGSPLRVSNEPISQASYVVLMFPKGAAQKSSVQHLKNKLR